MTISASLLGLVLAIAQTAPPSVSPRDARDVDLKAGTAIVRGRVTDAETAAPLSRVTVSLSRLGTRAMRETTTDANGAFEFTRVTAGAYSLLADPTGKHPNYRPKAWGAIDGRPPGKHSTIVLEDAQVFDKADMALPRSFVITGRVFDEDGDPVADVLVKAESIGTARGSRSRTTDDLGAFRLWGFTPGTYRVCATPLSAGPDRQATEGFITTCYPSVPESEAEPVTIPNAGLPEIEIRLRRSRLFRISGYAIDASGAVAPLARATFVTLDRDGSSMSARTAQTERGTFTVRGLAPGEYQIRAELGYPDDDDRQFGVVSVTVAAADVDNVAVPMSTAAAVRGRLIFEGGAPPAASRLTVRAQPPRGRLGVYSGATMLPSIPGADYTFGLRRLFGPHEIIVDGAPGWVIKSVRFRGEERVNIPTDFKTNRDFATVDVVLTNRTATVSGRVTDARGQPLEDARVLMFSTDPRQWDGINPSRLALQRDGAYEIKGVPAGEYYMAVLKPGAPFSMWDRKIYEELSKSADKVAVLEADVRTVDLTVR